MRSGGTAQKMRTRVQERIGSDPSTTQRLVDKVTPTKSRTEKLAETVDDRLEPAREAASERLEPAAQRMQESLANARQSLAEATQEAQRAAELFAERTRATAERVGDFVDEHVDEETVRAWGPRVTFALVGLTIGFLLGWLVARPRRDREQWDEREEGLAQAPVKAVSSR